MSTIQDEWELYGINLKNYIFYGKIKGLIKPFEKEIFHNIRDLFYNNIPAVVLLLDDDFVQGNCYSRAKLLAYAFKDNNYEVITANVDGLKLNPANIQRFISRQVDSDYQKHCYIRRLEDDGRYWIYDTSQGVKIEESLYRVMQNPEVLEIAKPKISLNDLNLRCITGQKLAERGKYIKDTIVSIRETCNQISEEFKPESSKELNEIERIREENKKVLLDELKEIEKEINKSEEKYIASGAKK